METAALPSDIFVGRDAAAPGSGRLVVTRVGARSVVTAAYATSPLRWLMPRNHGHAAWIFSSTFGGGLVDGDALQISVAVEPAATATATDATATSARTTRST